MVVSLSSPQAARKAASPAEPPPTARKRRRDCGPARSLISAISVRLLVRIHAPSYGEGETVDQNPPMATSTAAAEDRARSAALLVLASIVSVQCGSALATSLFDEVGTAGAVFLRAAFGALALVALTRGAPLRAREWPHRDVLLLAVAVAAVNLFFYAALDRLPLGITVTLEFVGPLGVAIIGSRRPRDVVWVVLAAAGILLLSDGGGEGVDALGVVLALTAGFFWGAYIVLSDRVGALAPGVGGATMAAVLSAVMVAPLGLAEGGGELLHPAEIGRAHV